MAQTSLPPGFRFHPTDVELVSYYLKRKIMGKKLLVEAISMVELYKYAPWDLRDKSCLRSNDLEWYFFCPRDKKYPKGSRTNRTTPNGYWKTTGKDRTVMLNSRVVGMKKTLIFHTGKAPKGDRTDWVMYEYRMEDNEVDVAGFSKDAYVLSKIFKKSGLGPKTGEQYGAPFNEEEWDDVNAGSALFPMMSSPSSELANSAGSKLANAVGESHVGHTTAASVKEPPILTAAAAASAILPFDYDNTSTAAVDELECRRSEVVSENHASGSLNTCHPPGFGRIVSDEWTGFFNDTHDCGGVSEQLLELPAMPEAHALEINSDYLYNELARLDQLTELPAMPETEAHAFEINSDCLYNELARLVPSEGVPTVHDQCDGFVNTEFFNPHMISEIGTDDHYLEINDFFPSVETTFFEMPVADNFFPQHSSDHLPHSQFDDPHYGNNGAFTASLAADNSIPSIPSSTFDMSVDIAFTTNLAVNSSSNPTMYDAS